MADDTRAFQDSGAIAAADYAMRNWTFPEPGDVRIGTAMHRHMFCKQLLETHNPYKPAIIDWPELPPDALQRVMSLPIWDIAIQTEGRASIRVRTYAQTVNDNPLLRAALDMDAGEEARHKVVLAKLVEAYGIRLAPEPAYPPPKHPEWAWMVTGYSECIDSFFAFGLFEAAKRTGYFPMALVETFEPVIQEECRHILFFANWIAWHRRQLPTWKRPWFRLKIITVWLFLVWERIGLARGFNDRGEAQDANFAMTGGQQVGVELGIRALLQICLAENDRRMAGYDPRLLRPVFVPRCARLVCWLSTRRRHPAAQ
ncbi:MAG: ferritin-like domain-containing protein [Nevskiaceae bacterium]|nr:MAG: ferritin-like domain-containing protein [Nevskiaceae bacterium]TBR71827.1 MAG: ferritin-like domain-containing protein [Nevskiaceae bacterium]